MRRDVGRLGEKQFDLWASEMNVTINPSKEDERGWDFIIEIPDYLQRDYHLAKYPHPIKSFVQVKSKDKGERSVSIKLSNWRNLIDTPLPTFILIFEFLGKNEPQNAFMIHIGEDLIKRYYGRLKELDPSAKLNKKTMTVSYGKNEKIENCDSYTLFKTIVNHIKPNFQKYTIDKTDLINEYGYDPLNFDFTIHFDLPEEYGDDIEEYLVDFALGIVGAIEFNELEIHDEDLAQRELWQNLVSLSFERKSIGKADLKFRTEDYSEQILLELDAYLPDGVSHIVSKNKLKMLFQGDFFYYIKSLHSHESKLKVNFPEFEKSFQLNKAEKLCRLIEFLEKVEDMDQKLISETIIGDGETYQGRGKFEILEKLPPKFIEVIKPLRHALSIANYFDIEKDVITSLKELWRHKKLFSAAYAFINSKGVFKLTGMWSEEQIPEHNSTATPLSISLNIGSYYLYLGAIIIGKLKIDKEENDKIFYEAVETSEVKILRKNITKKEIPDKIKEDLKEQIHKYIDERDDLILIELDTSRKSDQ
jgi:hypothetical protein